MFVRFNGAEWQKKRKYVISIFSSTKLVVKELLNLENGFKHCICQVSYLDRRLMSPLKISLNVSGNASGDSEHGGNYPDYKSWWLNRSTNLKFKIIQ